LEYANGSEQSSYVSKIKNGFLGVECCVKRYLDVQPLVNLEFNVDIEFTNVTLYFLGSLREPMLQDSAPFLHFIIIGVVRARAFKYSFLLRGLYY